MPQTLDLSMLSPLSRFKMATRRNRQPLQDISLTAVNQYARVDLPQVGLVSGIWVHLFGTVVTGAAGAGTFDVNYWPMNLLNSIAVRSNEGLDLYRSRGYTNLLINMARHMGYCPAQLASANGFNNPTTGARVAVSQYPTGAVGVSTTYNVAYTYYIPIAIDDALNAGLLLLQNQSSRMQLELQVGASADWGITAGFSSVSLTARPVMEFFSVPEQPADMPDLTFVSRWEEDNQAWTASGDQTYKVPVNGVICKLIADWQNAGAPQAFFAANDPNTRRFGNVSTQYAASMRPEIEDYAIALARNRYFYGQDFPLGVMVFDYSLGGGSVEQGLDGRDTYDTSHLTEFSLVINTTVTPGANSRIFFVRNELQPREI